MGEVTVFEKRSVRQNQRNFGKSGFVIAYKILNDLPIHKRSFHTQIVYCRTLD